LSHQSATAIAYVGPGAGFAFLGSLLNVAAGLLIGLVNILLLPFRMLWMAVTGRKGYRFAKVKRLIFLGFDGLDYRLVQKYMSEGKMPNFSRLAEMGGFRPLRTTFPALSPVAWSTFATGVNPGCHNMFDFVNRNLKSYMPELSSARVSNPKRILKIGKYGIPYSTPLVELRRKSRTFWNVLSDHRIASTILRVPITFPPEQFNGRMLSAMCTPDLVGSQGTFAIFTTRETAEPMKNGNHYPLLEDGKRFAGEISGPENYIVEGGGQLKISFALIPNCKGGATLQIGEECHDLRLGEYTPWVRLTFAAPLHTKVRGIARFLLTEIEGAVSMYMTPINIDPEHPALPISHPAYYARYLANLLGLYSTLGMVEDTSALNERAIDEDAFLKQAYLAYEERKGMFFSALERSRRGVIACVFDTTDRVQHMFFRHAGDNGRYGQVIENLYRQADALAGETLAYLDHATALIILSDHGFASFDRGVNLNTWLFENGYLALRENTGREYLKDVDWSHTKAYALGLAGIYINQIGRESRGIVEPSAAGGLRSEIAAKLTGLYDNECGRVSIRNAWPSNLIYKGPYVQAAPDVIVGYANGYRASWDSAVGRVSPAVFDSNEKSWSGDHCVDPELVPGVLLSNLKIVAQDPGIEDMAPTALNLFGIVPPAYMEGEPVLSVVSRRREKVTA
jgi:predicted AlkP superfamily phosphohydrolase/phosphomutase